MLNGVHGESHRGQHEQYRRNRRRFGERCGRAAGSKRGLTALTAEGSGNVSCLTALQQHNHNQKQTDDDVNDGDKNDHGIEAS